MDPTKMLEADHRQVEDLFEKIDEAEGDARIPFVEELATSLRAHMQLEEDVVYPAMTPVTGEEMAEEGENEHALARQALDQVVELSPDGPGFEGALETLKAAITHHVEDEEGEVFPKLRQDGSEVLAEMATPFMHKRQELGLPVDGAALAEASTKEELLEEARNAGIERASSMTKDELADALVSAMG